MEHEEQRSEVVFGGMIGEPLAVRKEPLLSDKERDALDKARHERRMQWALLLILGTVVLGLLSPLVVWLIRLALG